MAKILIWKPIRGYKKYYEISSYGNVRSIPRKDSRGNRIPSKILKQDYSGRYFRVTLCKNGKTKRFSIHRLVCKAFIKNPRNKPEVNHKDGLKRNNYFKNLEWCTKSENSIHSYEQGLQDRKQGIKNPQAILKEQEIREIRILKKDGFRLRDISDIYKISPSNLVSIIKRDTWKHIS